MSRIIRKTISVVAMLGVLLFGYVTLTVPSFAATAPAIITIAFAVAAYIAWPKGGKTEATA